MEKQNLPNTQTVFILGIISIVGTCCCTGFLGIACGIIALVYYNKYIKFYEANPNILIGYDNLKTGRILAIIGLILGILSVIYTIYAIESGLMDEYMNAIKKISEQK